MAKRRKKKKKKLGAGICTRIRMHGGRMDCYFSIKYVIRGKQVEDGIGYRSDGVDEEVCFNARKLILANANGNTLKGLTPGAEGWLPERWREVKAYEKRAIQKEAEKNITFDRAFQMWSKYIALIKKNKTAHDPVRRYHKWIEPRIGALVLRDITPTHIEKIMHDMSVTYSRKAEKIGLANSTIDHVIKIVRSVYGHAERHDLFEGPFPTSRIERPKIDNKVTEHLFDGGYDRLLKSIEKHRARRPLACALVEFHLYTGLRRDEVFNLKWTDISYEREVAFIRDSKTGDFERKLFADAIRVLKNWERRRRWQTDPDSPYIFPGRAGRKRTRCLPVKQILKDAGLDHHRPTHSFRHAFISFCIKWGLTVEQIMELMNIKDPTVLRRYVTLHSKAVEEAVEVGNAGFAALKTAIS